MPLPICHWSPTRVSKAVVCALGLTWLASSFSVVAQTQTGVTQPLTLEAALLAAQARSKALPAGDAAATAAREQAVAAARLPDPMLRLSVDNLPADGPKRFSLTEDFMTMRSIGLTQTFTREGKRIARAERFEREAAVAVGARNLRLLDLRRNTALAWFDRYYQQLLLDLLTRQHTHAAAQIESADAAFRAGRGSQADVFLARATVARLDDRLRDVQTRLTNAGTTLRRWVGDAASAPLASPPSLSKTRLQAPNWEQHVDAHPDIALMTAKQAVAQAEANVALQEKHADWTVSMMYSQRGPDFSNMLTVGVSIPLQWDQKNRQDRELAAKLAKLEQARDEREEVVREHLGETQRWLTTWRSNLARLHDYDATLVPLASYRTEAALASYRGGKASLSNVLEAQRIEIDTHIERLRIEMETASLWVALEYLVAQPLADAAPTMRGTTAKPSETQP